MESNKIWPLLIIISLVASATLMANPTHAETNPSVPEFTVQYVDHSYTVPVTYWYSTDPYTGQQITHSSGGNYVENKTIDVTITNQPFTPYLDSQNHTIQLYYNVRSKGHFEDWTSTSDSGSHSMSGLQASTSTYTVVSFNIEYWDVSPGGQIDFQVEAVIGYTYFDNSGCYTAYQTTVGDSGWSNTETITIGNPSPATATTPPISTPNSTVSSNPTASPIQNSTATPNQPNMLTGVLSGFDWEQTAIIVMAVMIAVLAVALVLGMRRKVAAK
jgi:hypothetical protein